MLIHDITHYLHTIAPAHLQEDYDNAGLIVGNPATEVTGVLLCLDTTESVVDEAIAKNCNLIIAHHPIVFRGLKRFNGSTYVERTVMKAIKNDIAIFAIHTNLDNVLHKGVNGKIAHKLGLNHPIILAPKGEYNNNIVGAGAIGELPEAMEPHRFIAYLKDKMELDIVKSTPFCKTKVQKIALCGGAGVFLLADAISAEADVFITSDIKYHEYFDANNQIIIMDIGHYESEKYTIDLLYELIINKFSTFALQKSIINTNPIKYF